MSDLSCGNLAVQLSTTRGHRLSTVAPVPCDAFGPAWPPAVAAPAGAIGRQAALVQLGEALTPGRPVMVHGRSGVGVSTLLQLVAAGAAGVDPQAEPVVLIDATDRPAPDLLRELFALAFTTRAGGRALAPTPDQCRELLAGLVAVVVLDHVPDDPAWQDAVLPVLGRCRVLLGGTAPARSLSASTSARSTSARSTSLQPALGALNFELPGLGEQHCVELIANELPTRLSDDQERAARMLAVAVHGVPRQVRQAAALVRVGAHTLPELATRLAVDPGSLEELSLAALPRSARRVIAGLAALGGLAAPVDVVRTVTEVAEAESVLRLLRGRGLVEPRTTTSPGGGASAPRYGVPARVAARYAELLAGYADPGAAAHSMISHLFALGGGATALDAAAAATALLRAAAERGDDACVVKLAGLLEPALLVRGDWTRSAVALDLGVAAAQRRGDDATRAYLAHQRGVLAAVAQEPGAAAQAFTLALDLRRRLGDQLGEARTLVDLTEVAPARLPAAAPAATGVPRARRGLTRRLQVGAGWSAALVVAAVAVSGFAEQAGGGTPQALGRNPVAAAEPVPQASTAAAEPVPEVATAAAEPVPAAATAAPPPDDATSSPSPPPLPDLVPAGVEVPVAARAAVGRAVSGSVGGVSLATVTRFAGGVLGMLRHAVDLVAGYLR